MLVWLLSRSVERYAARRWQSKLQKKNKDEDEEIVIVRLTYEQLFKKN